MTDDTVARLKDAIIKARSNDSENSKISLDFLVGQACGTLDVNPLYRNDRLKCPSKNDWLNLARIAIEGYEATKE